MYRRALFFAFALVGCASETPKVEKVSKVQLPEGLARPAIRTSPTVVADPVIPTKVVAAHPTEKTKPARESPPTPRSMSTNRTDAVRTAPSVPTAPPIPKADETHRLGYRIDGVGAVELEGVCRYGEDAIECWDGERKPNKALQERIESALKNESYSNGLNIRFGRKNRIVVVRQEQIPATTSGPIPNLSVRSVGTDSRYGGGNIYLPTENRTYETGKPYVNFNANLVTEDGSAKETQMRIVVSEPMPEVVDLELRKGATAKLGGCTFTVESLGKGDTRHTPFYNPNGGQVWIAKVRRAGKPSRPATFSASLDTSMYLDPSGKLVGSEAFMAWQRKRMEQAQKSGGSFGPMDSPFKPVQAMGYAAPEQTTFEIMTSIEPKRIGKLHLRGAYQRTVDVTGIPLDPR